MSSDNKTAHHDGSSGRRVFLGQLAAGAAASAGVLGLTRTALAIPEPIDVAGGLTLGGSDPELWLEKLTGKHKQMVDAYKSNDGWPLGFTHTFLATHAQGQAGAVLVLRHFAMPMALNHDIWTRYKIGTALEIPDPATKQPAKRNPFFKPAPGVLLADDMAIDRLISRGVIVGACNVALTVLSGMFAANAGVTKEKAAAEWKAGIIPGITVIPSGTWGVNRAQERGCTYCTGGG
jgi:hypothetical protein